MAQQTEQRKQMMDEVVNRRQMGDKKYHSETSLQQYEGDEEGPEEVFGRKDPGVHNASLSDLSNAAEDTGQMHRRTLSQPGLVSGNFLAASAARAVRRKPPKNVMYAPELEDSNSDRTNNLSDYRSNASEGATPSTAGDKTMPFIYNNQNGVNRYGDNKYGDNKSLGSYRLYVSANDLRGNATPRKRSVATMDAQSLRSIETHAPPPTSPQDNFKLTSEYLSLVMSAIYAVLLVTLGLIFYLGESFVSIELAVIYSICLCGIGLIYILLLIFDINRYKSIALKNQRIKGLHEENLAEYFKKQEEDYHNGPSTPGDRSPEVRPQNVPPPVLIPLKHQYCFSQGRHSGSFYLKMGAAAFAIGHLVHSVLLITVQVGFITDENIDNDDCIDIKQIVMDVMFPVYCFVQLYFIFKYSNVIILRGQALARFAFMHMIGSSLCFWISAIIRETTLALTIYANSVNSNGYGNGYNTNASKYDYEDLSDKHSSRFINISSLYNENCIGSKAIGSIVENFSPYLYPFSVEFNILIAFLIAETIPQLVILLIGGLHFTVAVYYIIWNNIGNCDNDDINSETASTYDDNFSCKIPTANEDNDFTSNIVIHADCHASNRGLFAGIMLLVVVIGMLIIGFVFSSVGGDFLELGYMLNDSLKLGIHGAMLISAVFTFNQLRKLDINEHPISLLDDVLLFICLPAFFLETVLSMIATVNIVNIIKSTDVIVMVVQVLIQTPLIMDGLRRCSNSRKLRRSKPGRELLMFLLIANVSMWLFNTFSYKSPESLDERYEFYGKAMWTVLGHISLPLIMFYRFHSSVCFADIWDSAYKPGMEH